MGPEAAQRRLAAILSADGVGYSRLMADDEDATVARINAYREQVEVLVRQNEGRLVDFTGDNFLAEFPAALAAMRCAVEIQRVLGARNADLPEDHRLEFRIGLHLGDIRTEGERIFGDGVNIAARLERLAEPGGICVSENVHDLVQGKVDLRFKDLGEHAVKNLPRPVRAHRVEIGGQEPHARPWPVTERRALVACLLLLALAGAILLWRETGALRTARPIGAVESIAVLPLDNLSADPEQAYFTDGMTDALISDLAKIGSLRVVSRTSVMRYRNTEKPLAEIALELDVDAVLEGSVLRAGDSIRITAQLIDTRTDDHLWSETYSGTIQDILALQGRVARAVAREIEHKLTPLEEARFEKRRPVRPEAYEAYIRGDQLLKSLTLADHRKAAIYLERAVELDPGYAPAWASLALVYT